MAEQKACSVDGCEKPVQARGYCAGHYWRLRKHGHVGTEPLQVRFKLGSHADRDEQGRKKCRECKQWLPETEFTRDRKTIDGLTTSCKECLRAGFVYRRYGVTPQWHEETLAQQGGGCAICGLQGQKRMSVDHDHAHCGPDRACLECVRGLLCESCNLGLGSFADSADRMEAAARYLRSFSR